MSSRPSYAHLSAGLLTRKATFAPSPSAAETSFVEARPVRVAWRETDLAPRGLTRRQAAAYVGVSPTTFKKLVAAGVFAAPMVIADRRRWDRLALDGAFDRMSRHPNNT